MKIIYKIKIYLLLFISAVFLSSCLQCLKMNVKRPAPINLVAYNSIACLNFMSKFGKPDVHSYKMSDKIQRAILNSGQLKVLDRENLMATLAEKQLGDDYFNYNQDMYNRYFSGISADLILVGRVIEDEFLLNYGDVYIDSTDKKAVVKKQYINAVYRVVASIKIIDVKTSQLITLRDFSSSYVDKKSIIYESKININHLFDKEMMYNNCCESIAVQFKETITPYFVQARICFEEDDLMPELENARNLIDRGNYQAGLELLKRLTTRKYINDLVLSKAYYNYGIASVYFGNQNEAEYYLNQALKIHPSNRKYIDGINSFYTENDFRRQLQK